MAFVRCQCPFHIVPFPRFVDVVNEVMYALFRCSVRYAVNLMPLVLYDEQCGRD